MRQKRLWDAVLASPCFARMSATDQNWLLLIDRTGARDDILHCTTGRAYRTGAQIQQSRNLRCLVIVAVARDETVTLLPDVAPQSLDIAFRVQPLVR